MGRCHSVRSISIGLLILLVQAFAAGRSLADWKVYIAPGLGISGASVSPNGQAGNAPTISLGGPDDDSAPLIDIAVGLEVPMDELVPREWLLDVRLPDWPVRVELEAAFLREYEFRTKTSATDEFFTELNIEASFFVNLFLDVPLLSAYKPIQYTFSLGRQPAIRRWLEPASFYVGVGLNYSLTDSVAVSLGYRYVGLGRQKIDLAGPFAPTGTDQIEYDPQLHEFRVGIRIGVFGFFSPWR